MAAVLHSAFSFMWTFNRFRLCRIQVANKIRFKMKTIQIYWLKILSQDMFVPQTKMWNLTLFKSFFFFFFFKACRRKWITQKNGLIRTRRVRRLTCPFHIRSLWCFDVYCWMSTERHCAKRSTFGKAGLFYSLETPPGGCRSALMPHVCYGSENVNFSLCTLMPTEAW